jgi:hypothetical protein
VSTPPAPVLEEVRVSFEKSQGDLRDKLTARRTASSSLAPSSQAFDMDLSFWLPKSAPQSSPMLTDFSHTVTQKPGKQLEFVVTNLPSPTVRTQGNRGMSPLAASRVMILWPMCQLYRSLGQSALSILKILQKYLDMRWMGPLAQLWMLPPHQLMQAKLDPMS